jgi:hypothetical protein
VHVVQFRKKFVLFYLFHWVSEMNNWMVVGLILLPRDIVPVRSVYQISSTSFTGLSLGTRPRLWARIGWWLALTQLGPVNRHDRSLFPGVPQGCRDVPWILSSEAKNFMPHVLFENKRDNSAFITETHDIWTCCLFEKGIHFHIIYCTIHTLRIYIKITSQKLTYIHCALYDYSPHFQSRFVS